MHEAEKLSLEQIQAFLSASEAIRFEGETQKQIYHWIEQVLGRQEYHQQSRPARGLLRSYLTKMTGRSRAQVTRLIGSLSEERIARALRASSFSPALYSRRHRTAGHRRCGPREPERSCHAPYSGAGIPPVRQARV